MNKMAKDYKLVVTSHSLGAGTACLIAIMLHYERYHLPHAKAYHPSSIQFFAFAPPPVNWPLKTAPQAAILNTIAYVHNIDCVPSLSIDGIRRLVATINSLDATIEKIPTTREMYNETQEGSSSLAKAVLETKPLPDMEGDPGLAIPAHSLVWLAQQKDYDATTDDPRYKASVLDCRQHSQRVMTVHSRMIQDHMAPEYEAALSSLLQTKSDEKKEN
jgi:hypothetical protein